MAKGKFAVRARSKADADARWQAARTETDRLRSQVVRLRTVEAENNTLRRSLAEAQRQIADGAAPELQRMRSDMAVMKDQVKTARATMRDWSEASFDAVAAVLGRAGIKKLSNEWYAALAPLFTVMVQTSDSVPEAASPRIKEMLATQSFRRQVGS